MKKLLVNLSILSVLALVALPMVSCAPNEEAEVEAENDMMLEDDAAMDDSMEEMGEDMQEEGEAMEDMGDELDDPMMEEEGDMMEEEGEMMEEEAEEEPPPPSV